MSQILVVDNNEHITRMFQEVLSRAGNDITVAETGREAMRLIDNNRFDIAYVDLALDDTSGLNILCYLNNRTPETVSVVISGKTNIDYAIESIKAGAFRYMKKPFDVDDILDVTAQARAEYERRITSLSRESEPLEPQHYVKLLGDLVLMIPAMLLGFLVQQEIYYYREIPIFWGTKEVIYILASFAFCYSFIFTASYGKALRSNTFHINEMIKSYGSVFILFAAILFFVTDFIYGRLVLVTGFALGLPALWISRKVLSKHLGNWLLASKEGPRTLKLKSIPLTEPSEETETPTISTTLNSPKTELPENIEKQPAVDKRTPPPTETSGDWGSRLIREFRDNRLKKFEKQEKRKPEKVK